MLADEALAGRAKGILFGSRIAPGGISLVLLQRDAECHETLTFHHLAGALPKNQDSWR